MLGGLLRRAIVTPLGLLLFRPPRRRGDRNPPRPDAFLRRSIRQYDQVGEELDAVHEPNPGCGSGSPVCFRQGCNQ
jgi:hypothetical protein